MTRVIYSSLPAWPDTVSLNGRFKLLHVLRDRERGTAARRGAESTVVYFNLVRSTQRARHSGYPPCQQVQANPPIFVDGMRDGKVQSLPRVFVFNADHTTCLVLHLLK